MRRLILFLCLIYIVESKTNSKSLTESMGQEVIEIGAPVKELPGDLEEEPSVENDEESSTTTTIQVATKKDFRKKMDMENKIKDIEKIDAVKQDDEEARIEKELAEIYKDSSDYKSDSGEVKESINSTETSVSTESTSENSTEYEEKPAIRMRANFKFQPNSNDPKEIEKFRTSVDEISCDRNKLSATTTSPNAAMRALVNTGVMFFMSLIHY